MGNEGTEGVAFGKHVIDALLLFVGERPVLAFACEFGESDTSEDEPVEDAAALFVHKNPIEVWGCSGRFFYKWNKEEAAVPSAFIAVELDAEAVVAGDKDVVVAVELAFTAAFEFERERVATGECLDDFCAGAG